ncbi:MAG: hypothetical protein ABIL44_05740 [candidate division WOR-3 bacterium]
MGRTLNTSAGAIIKSCLVFFALWNLIDAITNRETLLCPKEFWLGVVIVTGVMTIACIVDIFRTKVITDNLMDSMLFLGIGLNILPRIYFSGAFPLWEILGLLLVLLSTIYTWHKIILKEEKDRSQRIMAMIKNTIVILVIFFVSFILVIFLRLLIATPSHK